MTKLITPDRLPEYGIELGDRQRRRLEDEGAFPRRVRMSARAHAYVEPEIIQHIERKIAERDSTTEVA